MNIGRAIKMCRTQKNLSLRDLSARTGITASVISRVERGTRNLGIEKIKAIADAMSIPVVVLVFLASDYSEMSSISRETIDRLSAIALELVSAED